MRFSAVASAAALAVGASAQTIAAINGNRFLSSMNGQSVTGVKGLVTATAKNGFWLRSTTPDNDPATSESIFVFSSSVGSGLSVGDIITLDGKVSEYRSDPTYIYLTEIDSPSNINTISSGNTVTPVVLGSTKALSPPTKQYTSLDNGNVFGVPNNQSQISVQNPVLKPTMYGMDFWESLSGELVTVKNAIAIDIPNSYGDTWVYGDWPVTGKNGRGGLTVTALDGNPEAILIQSPLDGSDNPTDTKLGDNLGTITGVITTAFGAYTIRPRTAISVKSSQSPALPPKTTLVQGGGCKGITMSDYNVDNLTPANAAANKLASQIVTYLKSPTILFLQEVQDNDGPTDDGVVDASQTLNDLIKSIQQVGGPTYKFIEINPLDDTTGGEPGGNIRNAYLYQPKIVNLRNPNPGNATQGNQVLAGGHLKYNPGFIQPQNPAFNDSRRPLAAVWETVDGNNPFFTINVHQVSKGGSSPLFGDARPPYNYDVTKRTQEAQVTGNFIKNILSKKNDAKIVAAGDWNEFKFVRPQLTFVQASGLQDMDDVVGTTPVERYSYLFDQNSQALIHFYVSPAVKNATAQLQRIHVNTWVDYNDRVSDHDPDVIKINVCAGSGP